MKNEPSTTTQTAHSFQNTKEIEAHAKSRMDKVLSDLQHEMAGSSHRTRFHGPARQRARRGYYGTPMPLNQLATLHVPDATMITVQPWDVSQIGAIEKAIRGADLGLNPANDGKLIRVPIPSLTEERRKDWSRRSTTSPKTIAWRCAMFAATATSTSRSF